MQHQAILRESPGASSGFPHDAPVKRNGPAPALELEPSGARSSRRAHRGALRAAQLLHLGPTGLMCLAAAAAAVVALGPLPAWGPLPALAFAAVALVAAFVAGAFRQMRSREDRADRHAIDSLVRRQLTLVDSSPDLVALIRRDGTYEYANPAFERHLGVKPGQLVGYSVLETIDERDRRLFYLDVLAVADREREQAFAPAIRFTCADAGSRMFEVSARPVPLDAPGDDHAIVMVARDVTDRISADERLRASEARSRTILGCAPDAIFTVDERGLIRECNAAATVMFGDAEGGGLRGQPIDRFLSPGVVGADDEGTGAMVDLARPTLRPVLCLARRPDGTVFQAEASLAVIRDGASPATVMFVRDISQRLRASARSLESQKLEAIGQLAGGVAHDFNNLLTVIKGYSDSILSGAQTDSEVREDVEEIRNAADRAAELTRQLLAFARRQRGQPGVVDPNELIAGMGRMLGRLVREDIEIDVRLAHDVAPVILDPGQFEQVIMNLVVNARDAMPSGGQVLIETRNLALLHRSAQAAGLPPGDYVQVSVVDTGTGMPPEVVAHAFEPFFTTKPPGEGTGLGLATCYGIIRQANGSITVESRLGSGTTFRILLPAGVIAPSRPAVMGPTDIGAGSETVLLVEDEPSVRTYGARVLAGLGYRVLTATDGVDALRELERIGWHVDLIVSDIVMPRMSGRQLVERVRARAPEMKVLLVSGYSPDALLSRGSLPSGVPLVPKPFTTDMLGGEIRKLLDERPGRVDAVAAS